MDVDATGVGEASRTGTRFFRSDAGVGGLTTKAAAISSASEASSSVAGAGVTGREALAFGVRPRGGVLMGVGGMSTSSSLSTVRDSADARVLRFEGVTGTSSSDSSDSTTDSDSAGVAALLGVTRVLARTARVGAATELDPERVLRDGESSSAHSSGRRKRLARGFVGVEAGVAGASVVVRAFLLGWEGVGAGAGRFRELVDDDADDDARGAMPWTRPRAMRATAHFASGLDGTGQIDASEGRRRRTEREDARNARTNETVHATN